MEHENKPDTVLRYLKIIIAINLVTIFLICCSGCSKPAEEQPVVPAITEEVIELIADEPKPTEEEVKKAFVAAVEKVVKKAEPEVGRQIERKIKKQIERKVDGRTPKKAKQVEKAAKVVPRVVEIYKGIEVDKNYFGDPTYGYDEKLHDSWDAVTFVLSKKLGIRVGREIVNTPIAKFAAVDVKFPNGDVINMCLKSQIDQVELNLRKATGK